MQKKIVPGRKARSSFKRAIAIDTETDPNTGAFLLAAVYGVIQKQDKGRGLVGYETIEKVFYDREQFTNFIGALEKRYRDRRLSFVFHNAAFDVVYLNELIDWNTAIYAGGRLITVSTFHGSKIYDTFNFVYTSLENAIKAFKIDERYGVTKLSLNDLENRCLNDAKATFYLFKTLEEFFIREFSVPVSFTLPGMAYKIYQKHFHKENWIRNNDKVDVFERQAYYGGRCEVFRRGTIDHVSYDVNSMYPAMMMKPLPKPDSCYWEYTEGRGEELVRKRLAEGKLFIIDADVYVPDQFIPPLPYRNEKGKLVFPVGEFRGIWCSPEIEAGINAGCLKVKKIHQMLTFSRSAPYLAGYTLLMYERRKEAKAKGDEVAATMYKLLMNSLYGKFGERHGGTNYVPIETFKGDLEGKTIIESNGEHYVIISQEPEDSSHSFTCISAFITSYARAYLWENMKKNEENVVYCDTDSIKLVADKPVNLPLSETELGAFKFEGRKVSTFYKPKVYGDKIKGVPKRHTVIETWENRLVVEYEKVFKRKESIRRRTIQNCFVKIIKELTLIDDKRVWNGDLSKPLKLP